MKVRKKKFKQKAWYRILGTDLLSYEEFHSKTLLSNLKGTIDYIIDQVYEEKANANLQEVSI